MSSLPPTSVGTKDGLPGGCPVPSLRRKTKDLRLCLSAQLRAKTLLLST